MVKAITRDKKTTLAGVIVILIAILQAAYAMVDGDPETVPDFQNIYMVIIGSGLLVAGDGGKNESTFKTNRTSVGGLRR